ncbi:MAG: Re/Si-specific NAD(P)(+) transhydrogenase subunit alpha [Acidobacteria bacterium]|nr:Re/Si-specific NAD(P)(+) transhydrogenase subunit alpha [Acidobacteriota bacterium]
MIIGVPKESFPGERRVALVPSALPHLAKAGLEVLIQSQAGHDAGYPDEEYKNKGARIAATRGEVFASAEIIAQVLCYGSNDVTGGADIPLMRRGQLLLGFLRPFGTAEVVQEIAAAGVTSFSVELMPRTTRAQSMDALSSMATICGYKAVLIAADLVPRIFPMLTTAAGTITPARVLVIGAGVAGLQAIATARRLGAVVSAYDLRPAAKEQVLSLGGRFVELPIEAQSAQDERGYARAQDEAFYARQRELLGRAVMESDVVISTAVVPGKKAPVLITGEMVRGMAPGSVVVDLAAERGGNCELTRAGEQVVVNGVTVIGRINVASGVPYHASQMYARNLTSFLQLLVKNGQVNLNLQDDIIRETLVTEGGEIVNPRVRQFFSMPELARTE